MSVATVVRLVSRAASHSQRLAAAATTHRSTNLIMCASRFGQLRVGGVTLNLSLRLYSGFASRCTGKSSPSRNTRGFPLPVDLQHQVGRAQPRPRHHITNSRSRLPVWPRVSANQRAMCTPVLRMTGNLERSPWRYCILVGLASYGADLVASDVLRGGVAGCKIVGQM